MGRGRVPETPGRRIYLLSPRHLSPETIAVAFAKTSRSPLSFDEIAAELTDERSAEFHEKWVVGYGHASVAEHAVLHIAFENVSRLASGDQPPACPYNYVDPLPEMARAATMPEEAAGTAHEALSPADGDPFSPIAIAGRCDRWWR
jgi:hypothetical protein